MTDVGALADGVRAGDRRSLARAITLVESARGDHVREAQVLLSSLMDSTGTAHRVGVSGTPGVGKSTFIEALGMHLIGAGKRVAVLAIDPTSPRTGGSLLGDKTRMQALAAHADAFIRPSPSGLHLGGVARKTREAMLLCEAAGFDAVIIETVGVGQSEGAVRDMVDTFALLLQPGSGDELQGVKRGVLELCDVIVVNKADGELLAAAKRARLEYERGMHLLRPQDPARVLIASALDGTGVPEAWEELVAHRAQLADSGALGERRAEQAERWLWDVVEDELKRRFLARDGVKSALDLTLASVRKGTLSATAGALQLLDDGPGA